jgi:hypothetical protein
MGAATVQLRERDAKAISPGRATLSRARPRGGAELLLLQLREQRVERTIEDLGDVAGRDLAAQ